MVETILNRLGLSETKTNPLAEHTFFTEGQSIYSGGKILCSYGVVDNSILRKMEVKNNVYFADFDWDVILDILGNDNITYREIPKFPEVTRDFALLLDEDVKFQQIVDIAWNTEKKLLKHVNLFDVYLGENLPEGKKSYAVSYTLQDENKTLTDKQIDKIMTKLKVNYEERLGATLR